MSTGTPCGRSSVIGLLVSPMPPAICGGISMPIASARRRVVTSTGASWASPCRRCRACAPQASAAITRPPVPSSVRKHDDSAAPQLRQGAFDGGQGDGCGGGGHGFLISMARLKVDTHGRLRHRRHRRQQPRQEDPPGRRRPGAADRSGRAARPLRWLHHHPGRHGRRGSGEGEARPLRRGPARHRPARHGRPRDSAS